MSFVSSLKSGFKNFGHYVAVVGHAVATGVSDVVKVAAKADVIEPEIELLIGALAGPLAKQITDKAFHALGDIAQAIEKIGPDAQAVGDTQLLNLQLDVQFINDIKALIPQLKAIGAAVKAAPPAV